MPYWTSPFPLPNARAVTPTHRHTPLTAGRGGGAVLVLAVCLGYEELSARAAPAGTVQA